MKQSSQQRAEAFLREHREQIARIEHILAPKEGQSEWLEMTDEWSEEGRALAAFNGMIGEIGKIAVGEKNIDKGALEAGKRVIDRLRSGWQETNLSWREYNEDEEQRKADREKADQESAIRFSEMGLDPSSPRAQSLMDLRREFMDGFSNAIQRETGEYADAALPIQSDLLGLIRAVEREQGQGR